MAPGLEDAVNLVEELLGLGHVFEDLRREN
jgi:hypothetical protein